MGKSTKRRRPPSYPTDDSYRRSTIGFGYIHKEKLDGPHGGSRAKRPSFLLEILPDAQGISIQTVVQEDDEDEEEDES